EDVNDRAGLRGGQGGPVLGGQGAQPGQVVHAQAEQTDGPGLQRTAARQPGMLKPLAGMVHQGPPGRRSIEPQHTLSPSNSPGKPIIVRRAVVAISRSQTPVWERGFSKLRFVWTRAKQEFRGRAFPNRSLGTRGGRRREAGGEREREGKARRIGQETSNCSWPP